MAKFIKHLVAIVPAAYWDVANQLSSAQGWGPDSYSVPLSADGSEPATHYGLAAPVTEAFFETMQEQGAASQEVAAVLSQIHMSTVDVGSEVPRAHFLRASADLGLKQVFKDIKS